MQPSVNYDYVVHGNHIHWCNVEGYGMEFCQEWAMAADSEFIPAMIPI